MKKSLVVVAVLAIGMGMMVTSCGGSKNIPQADQKTSAPSSATQKKIQEMQDEAALLEAQAKLDAVKRGIAAQAETEVMDTPCFQADDDNWYTGTVARRSSVNKTNTLATACLRAARQNLQQKVKSALKQVTRDYFDQMDIDAGSTEASHIESVSELIVNQFINDMQETCRKQTRADEQGMIIMYIGVKISKKALVENLTTGLSKDQQVQKRFDEKVFRDDAFKVFSNDRQQSFDDYQNAKE